MDALKLLCIIVDREKVDKTETAVRKAGASFCHICYGKGTAKNDLLYVLGLGETEKGVIFAAVSEEKREKIFALLKKDFNFDNPGAGIAFTVPLASVGGPASLKILQK